MAVSSISFYEGDEVLMERAEGVDHEGRESRSDVLRVSIVFEVFGSASALDGFARTAGIFCFGELAQLRKKFVVSFHLAETKS